MADDMSVDDATAQRYGRVVIVGGGCYGGYYVRQLLRAIDAGAVEARELLVVDKDPDCAVAREYGSNGASVRVESREWRAFFEEYLSRAADDPSSSASDAIVPSPLMPHLMADWLVERAKRRWPERQVATTPLTETPDVPWERAGIGGTHYVSFATWTCPINCVEPRTCPHTRGPRSWSMPTTVEAFARRAREAGRNLNAAVLFCRHRAYGVGMFDTAEVLAADASIASAAAAGAAEFVIGTVSHCHGALTRLVIPAPRAEVIPPTATFRLDAAR
jgi:hypothetical protein